jgi:hypothetical protein
MNRLLADLIGVILMAIGAWVLIFAAIAKNMMFSVVAAIILGFSIIAIVIGGVLERYGNPSTDN